MSTAAGAPLVLAVRHLEDAAVARSVVWRAVLAACGDERLAKEVALGASELATNAVKYAGGGELRLECEAGRVVLRALDRGPGPPSKEALLADGWRMGAARLPDAPVREGLGSGGAALGRFFDSVEVSAREGGGTELRCVRRVGAR